MQEAFISLIPIAVDGASSKAIRVGQQVHDRRDDGGHFGETLWCWSFIKTIRTGRE